MKIIAWVEEHPYESAGIIAGALALILIIMHYKNAAASAASSAMPGAPAIDPSVYQADAAAYAQSQQAASQASMYAAGVQASQNIAQLQADTSVKNTTTAAGVQTAAISAQEAIQLAGIQSQNTIAQIQANLQSGVAGLQAGVQNNQIAANQQTVQSIIGALTPHNDPLTSQINSDYSLYLGRAPSAAETSWYVNQIETGQISISDLGNKFMASPEYQAKAGK